MTTLEFARYELHRYLAQMGVCAEITLTVAPQHFDPTRFERFDPALDDAFSLAVTAGKGEILATNPRSVLFGVYHLLKLQGCRFLRPGAEGEFVPRRESVADCEATVYAKFRHRYPRLPMV